MADPVLRIPVDDEAFKRYMSAYERYQSMLDAQPEMWQDANAAIRDGVTANLALADAIGASVSAAMRLGDEEERNAQKRRRERQEEEASEQRSSRWRRQALDHVQQASRSASAIVRGFADFATGGTGGLFGSITSVGKSIGGAAGGIVELVGHVFNAGYDINNAVADKGQFARGIGASVSEQEGYRNNLGRYTNTDQGIDWVMNARGDPTQWAPFAQLNVKGFNDPTKSNSDVYADLLRKQVGLARSLTKGNITNWNRFDAMGGNAAGTTHENINRLLKVPNFDQAIKDAASFKSSIGDKEVDAATKTIAAMDNLTTKTQDAALAVGTRFDGALDKATASLNKLADIAERIVAVIPDWIKGTPTRADGKPVTADNPPAFDPSWQNSGGNASIGSGSRAAFGVITRALKTNGLSDTAANAVAAGIMAESGGNASAKNAKTGAFGIGQWFGSRKSGLTAMAEKDHVSASDMTEQLKYLVYELRGGDAHGKDVLNSRSTEEALHNYVYKFMRPEGSAYGKDHAGSEAQRDMQRGRPYLSPANVNLKVQVQHPPGTQVNVSANSAGKGG